MAEREARCREPLLHLPHRSSASPRFGVAPHRRQDVGAQRLELSHGGVLRLGRPHLEGGVPRDRHAHQSADHLGEVAGLATLLPFLGRAHLFEQRAHRRDRAERLETPPEPAEILARDAGRPGDVLEADDLADRRVVVGMPEREVPHPAAVRADHVADPEGEDESADRRRREDRAGQLIGVGRATRVEPLVCPFLVDLAVRDVRDAHDELDRRLDDVARELVDRHEALRDRVRERVLVETRQRELPQAVGAERLVRRELQHEPLQRVEPVDDRHHPGQRTGGRAVDPADRFPERVLAQPAQEAELEEQAVHPAA